MITLPSLNSILMFSLVIQVSIYLRSRSTIDGFLLATPCATPSSSIDFAAAAMAGRRVGVFLFRPIIAHLILCHCEVLHSSVVLLLHSESKGQLGFGGRRAHDS